MTLRTALRLGRVSNLPTVTSNVLAAIALSGAHPTWLAIGVICAAMSLLYIAGMYLNDAFDRDIDRNERPERPIPSGEADAAGVFAAGFALLGFGVLAITGLAIATGAGWRPIASVVALAALIVLYDMVHKRTRTSPLIMGLCRVGVYTTATLAVGASLDHALLVSCGALLAYLIGLTYVARQENLARISNQWPLVFLAIPFVVALPHGAYGFAVYAMFVGWTIRALQLVLRRDLRAAVTGLIAGISLLDALFVVRTGRLDLAVTCVAAFVLTTIFQRTIAGT